MQGIGSVRKLSRNQFVPHGVRTQQTSLEQHMLDHLTGQSDSVRSNVGCLHYPGPAPSYISDRRGNWGRQRRSPRQGTVWRRCTSARTLPLRAARSNCSKGSWDTRRDSPPQGSCGWQRQHMERRASNGRSCSRGSWGTDLGSSLPGTSRPGQRQLQPAQPAVQTVISIRVIHTFH